MLNFPHMGGCTKAAPEIGWIRARTPRTWNHFSGRFQKWMEFWPFFDRLVLEGEGRGRGNGGTWRFQFASHSRIYLHFLCPFALLKVLKNFQKEWKNRPFSGKKFWRENFLKKWRKKVWGLVWGLGHRKQWGMPKYLISQSPQPNPHTFFLH